MRNRLSHEKRLEKAFYDDEFESAEAICDLDASLPPKVEKKPFYGILGEEAFVDVLDISDLPDPEARTHNK